MNKKKEMEKNCDEISIDVVFDTDGAELYADVIIERLIGGTRLCASEPPTRRAGSPRGR